MEKLKVGQERKTVSGDIVKLTQSNFISGPKIGTTGKPLNESERKRYIFVGHVVEAGPQRAEGWGPGNLKWCDKGKAWGTKKNQSLDLACEKKTEEKKACPG